MRKVKLIVHETYQGKRKSEDVFTAVFLSNAAALTPNTHSGIIKDEVYYEVNKILFSSFCNSDVARDVFLHQRRK